MKKSMQLRTAKKIVKVIDNDGLEEAVRRYGKARVDKAQRKWKGEPEKPASPEPIVIKSWEHYLEVTRKPKRRRASERYRNLKDRNSKLAKLKYPWIK